MVDFDQEFFDSNRIVLETLDDIGEYTTTVDVWLSMHDQSEKDVIGSESFGYYELHLFDQPVEIVTSGGDMLDSFMGAVVFDSPGEMSTRETHAYTFPSKDEAQSFFESVKNDFYDFSMREEGEEYVDLGEIKGVLP